MKKTLRILFTTILLFLTSCSKINNMIIGGMLTSRGIGMNDEKPVEECYARLEKGLKEKDKDKIKSLFSKKVLNEVKDIDEQIEYMLEYLDGEIGEFNDWASCSSGKVNYGEYTYCKVQAKKTLSVGDKEYIIYASIITIDKKNPDNLGVNTIYVLDKIIDNEMTHGSREIIYWDEIEEHLGIWIPQFDD